MDVLHDPNLYKVLLFSFIAFSALGFFLYVLNDIDLTFKRQRYTATLKQAITSDRLANDDIYRLATRWFVKKEQITATLNLILSDYLNDKNCSDNELSRIRELIVWHQKNDPFADLPDDIKLQLQRIQKMTGDDQEDILRLSKSLSEIYLSNQRKAKREWVISRLSLIIGVAGLLYGFFK